MDSVYRYMEADYMEVGEGYEFMGTGFTALDENPNAQTDEKTYIHEKSSTTSVTGYKPTFPFTADMIKSEKVVMDIWSIARNQKTGADAERKYVKVDLYDPAEGDNTYKARLFTVSVQVDSKKGEGGNINELSGNLNSVGGVTEGTFNTTTKTFTADAATQSANTNAMSVNTNKVDG